MALRATSAPVGRRIPRARNSISAFSVRPGLSTDGFGILLTVEVDTFEPPIHGSPCEYEDRVCRFKGILAHEKAAGERHEAGAAQQHNQCGDYGHSRDHAARSSASSDDHDVILGGSPKRRGAIAPHVGSREGRRQPSISRTSPARGPLPDSSGVNSTRCPSRRSSNTAPRTELR